MFSARSSEDIGFNQSSLMEFEQKLKFCPQQICRANVGLHLSSREFCLILNGFENTKLQSSLIVTFDLFQLKQRNQLSSIGLYS